MSLYATLFLVQILGSLVACYVILWSHVCRSVHYHFVYVDKIFLCMFALRYECKFLVNWRSMTSSSSRGRKSFGDALEYELYLLQEVFEERRKRI